MCKEMCVQAHVEANRQALGYSSCAIIFFLIWDLFFIIYLVGRSIHAMECAWISEDNLWIWFSLSTMCTLVEVSIDAIEHEDPTAQKGFISVYNC